VSRLLTAAFLAEAAKSTNRPIYLYELQFGAILYLTSCDVPITFPSSGGQIYTPYTISHSDLNQENGQVAEQLSLSIGNADLEMSSIFAHEDLRKRRVTIKKVFLDLLSDYRDCMEWVFFVDTVTVEEEVCVFGCTSRVDVIHIKIPRRTFSDKCPWIFKGTECTYPISGPATKCKKSWDDCLVTNKVTFGGFIAIPIIE